MFCSAPGAHVSPAPRLSSARALGSVARAGGAARCTLLVAAVGPAAATRPLSGPRQRPLTAAVVAATDETCMDVKICDMDVDPGTRAILRAK